MTSATLEKMLEVKTGPLAQIYPLFEPDSLQHAHEIMTARRTDSSLQNRWFWTADFPMYSVEDGEEVLYFAGRDHNLMFRDIQNATSQLLRSQNYVPPKEGIGEVVAASKTGTVLRVKLSDLKLERENDEWGYFKIDTSNPDSLNLTQRAFAERVYGQGAEFAENMQMLQKAGKEATRIYVLNPDYVKSEVKGDGAIARASWLGRFGGSLRFFAGGRGVDDPYCSLRGVLRKSA